jgi:peptidoglycan/LPS O-acetylase OafA/YrhL
MNFLGSQTNSRIPALDGLRGLAILLVLFYHYGLFNSNHGLIVSLIQRTFSLFWTGVDLFFVLSGFLIGGILIDSRNSESYFRTFYLRRVCRIFPLYFLWLGLFFLVTRAAANAHSQIWYNSLLAQNFSAVPRWSFVVFLQNIFYAKNYLVGALWMAPTWSLAVEEQFYLFLPLLIWIVPTKKLPWVLIPLILFAPAFRLFLYLYHSNIYPFVLLPCRLDTLLIGVLCSYLLRCEITRRWLENKRDFLYGTLLGLSWGIVYFIIYAPSQRSFEMIFFGYTWMALFYGVMLLIIMTVKKCWITHVMNFSPLRNLGMIAYCVYLIHLSVNILLHDLILKKTAVISNFADFLVTLLALIVTLILARISWKFFEKPIIAWGHSFSYETKNWPCASRRVPWK